MRLKQFIQITGAVFLLIIGASESGAQSTRDLRINEVLVYNDSNYVDDFGKHSPWIEIFNSAYNTVDVGGLFITDDLKNPTKYPIFKGQSLTKIPKRSYLVIWADNKPTQGILHLNFILEPGKTIALFEGNGKTLIDSLTIPNTVQQDVSYGRLEDGGPVWDNLPKTTPNSNNITEAIPTAGDEFKKFDPTGIGMAMIAMSVVFSGLAALYFFFKMSARLLGIGDKKKSAAIAQSRTKKGGSGEVLTAGAGTVITGEVNAAIAMTLHLYASELHDAENTVLTINKVSRTYSPWNSKIYGLNRYSK